MVVAADNAQFGLPEVKLGLIAAAGGLLRLPDRIPQQVAMELVLTGDSLDARRAHALGLVNRLTEPGGALDGALALARSIAANGPLGVRMTKHVLRELPSWPVEERWERQLPLMNQVLTSEDAQEGARAFTEKRRPKWTGR
jgi:enoyl-CoA hydratase